MLFCKAEGLLGDFLLHIKLKKNTVGPCKNLVPVLYKNITDRQEIRTL